MPSRRSMVFIAGGTLALLSLLFLFWEDFYLTEKSVQFIDYRNSFYVAGTLVRQGKIQQLYPSAGSKSFGDTDFNKVAHEMLPGLRANQACNFLYPPIVAFIFAPLSILPPRWSTAVWQVISLSALAFSCRLFARHAGGKASALEIFVASFLCLPLVHVLIIGQLAVLYGILPLMLGYVLWKKQKPFAAGLCWSVLSVKLQLFFPVAIVIFAFIAASLARPVKRTTQLRQSLQVASGTALGIFWVFLIPFLIAGPESLSGWLRTVKLVDASVMSPGQLWAQQTVLSLPAAITFLAPDTLAPTMRMVSSALSALMSLVWLATAILVVRKHNTEHTDWCGLALLVSYLFLPLASPYLRFYDCTIFLMPTWLWFFSPLRNNPSRPTMQSSLIAIWLSLDVFWLLLWTLSMQNQHLPTTLIILPLSVTVAGCIVVAVRALRTPSGTQTSPAD